MKTRRCKRWIMVVQLIFTLSSYAASPVRVELKPYIGKFRTVSVEIAGKQHSFLFDTAGGVTILTPQTAAGLCEPFGRISLFRMTGDRLDVQRCGVQRLKIGSLETQTETAILDLMALLPKDVPPIGGLLALNAFHNRIITIDLKSNLLVMETEESLASRISDMDSLRMRLSTSPTGNLLDLFLGVRAAEEILWFELDSGNLDDVLISPHAMRLLKVSEPEVDLHLEGFSDPVKVNAKEKDLIYDGVLNAATMERMVLTIDFRSNRIWGKLN